MKRAGCVLLVTILAATRAYAAPAPAEGEMAARQHFRIGEAHYSGGQFAEALTEYEAGYAAVPLPGFLVNIAQCHRRLGHLEEARRTYQKFVLVAPDSPLAPEVRGLIADLDKLLAPPAATAGVGAGGSAAGTRSRSMAPQGSVNLLAPPPFVPLRQGSDLTAVRSDPDDDGARTRASHWWFWGAVTAAAIGGVIAIVALSPGSPNTIHDGSLGTLRR